MNDKLTVIGSKFYQECDVIILPTEKASKILLFPKEDNLLKFSKINCYSFENSVIAQHLYILSSEKIKEGDWCIDEYNKVIFQNKSIGTPGASKKIIATTDKSLIYKISVDCGSSVGNTIAIKNLPRPSDDFIKAFVKKQGRIDKVLVEYEGFGFKRFDLEGKPRRAGYQLKIAQDNTITIKKKEEICQCCGKPL